MIRMKTWISISTFFIERGRNKEGKYGKHVDIKQNKGYNVDTCRKA